jgi:hypothetical protein
MLAIALEESVLPNIESNVVRRCFDKSEAAFKLAVPIWKPAAAAKLMPVMVA